MTPPDGWDDILDRDEVIRWQGRPIPGYVLTGQRLFMALFGVFFAGFALFWMKLAATAPGFFWVFGMVHFSAGLVMIFGPTIWAHHRLSNSWYTLTNKRAIIATELMFQGRRLRSHPIVADTMLRLVDGTPGTVYFAQEMRIGAKRAYKVDIGFERLEDARAVYRMMRDIQTGAA